MTYPEYYINHGCDPNVYQKDGMVYALKSIKKGEQLFFDYAMNGTETWEMDCLCKLPNCRKVVFGNFFDLPTQLQKENLPYLQNWFVSKYKIQISNLS